MNNVTPPNHPVGGLTGPSRTIIVEPATQPTRAPQEPIPDPKEAPVEEPARTPDRKREPVPA